MGELTFKGIKVEEIDLTNKLEGQVQLDISQRASFNVKYTQDNLHCAANLTIDMMVRMLLWISTLNSAQQHFWTVRREWIKKKSIKKHMMKYIPMCVR